MEPKQHIPEHDEARERAEAKAKTQKDDDNTQHKSELTEAIDEVDSKDHEWQHKAGTFFLNLTNDDDVDGKVKGDD